MSEYSAVHVFQRLLMERRAQSLSVNFGFACNTPLTLNPLADLAKHNVVSLGQFAALSAFAAAARDH